MAGSGKESLNVSIVMLARELNPAIEIHARAESAKGTQWLRRASATEVVDPYQIAAEAVVRELLGGSKER